MSRNVSDNYPGAKMSDQELVDLALKNHAIGITPGTSVKTEASGVSKFPTEEIELPSRGLLYPEDDLLHAGVIEMKYMTAREEDILTTTSLIKQGTVLDKLFQSLIVTPIKYDNLLIGDKNAIMIAARILGYGKEYEVIVDDPTDPNNKQKVVIDLSTIEPKHYDFSTVQPGVNEFEIVLPISKRKLTFKLMTHGLEKEIQNYLKTSTVKKDSIDRELSTRMKFLITSVDGNSDRNAINSFVDREFLAQDSRFLREEIKRRTPDMDLTFDFVSSTTGETVNMAIPIDHNFFWPRA